MEGTGTPLQATTPLLQVMWVTADAFWDMFLLGVTYSLNTAFPHIADSWTIFAVFC